MKFKGVVSFLVTFAFLVSSGCGTSPQPSNPSSQIQVEITGTETKELGIETIPQPNCTGSAEVENVVEKSRQISYVLETQSGVQVNANGQVGFAGTDVELGATVSSQFGQSYGMAETLSRSLIVKASPGSNMQHTVKQQEIWKLGKATITVGGQQTVIPFKYRYDFTIELVNSLDLQNCDTSISTNSQPSSSTESIPTENISPTISASPQSSSMTVSESIDFYTLIGRKIDDPLVETFMQSFGETSHRCDNWGCIYTYYNKGIDFNFDDTDILSAIHLYDGDAYLHQKYKGSLPYELDFSYSKTQVEEILGKSLKSGGERKYGTYVIYDNLGLLIDYWGDSESGQYNHIKHIAVMEAK